MMVERVTGLGTCVDLLDMEQTVQRCVELVEARRPAQHIVINAGKVVMARDDARLRSIIGESALVNADGQAVVWGMRALGHAVPERVTGIDLMAHLLDRAERNGYPVYFLGARPEVLERFLGIVRRRYPRLIIAGAADGYYDDPAAAARAVGESGARLLFLAMPSPKKEYFAAEHAEAFGPALVVGVGGTFDVWAGVTKRAPQWMQRAGLEWLYRFLQEPRRMWRRYLVGNSRFMALVAHSWFSRVREA